MAVQALSYVAIAGYSYRLVRDVTIAGYSYRLVRELFIFGHGKVHSTHVCVHSYVGNYGFIWYVQIGR